MKYIAKAIKDWLVADATILSLTGHSSSDLRVYGNSPEIDVKKPSIVFLIAPNPLPTKARTLREARITFTCIAETKLSVDDLQERIVALLTPNTTEGRLHGVAINNANVRINSLEFIQSGTVTYNESIKAFTGDVIAQCFWYLK